MKKIFVDTNILVDLVADRKPFSKFAIELFKEAEMKKVTLFTSFHAMVTTHYLLKKYTDEKELRNILYDLLDFICVIPVDVDIIKKGLKSNHNDFEDAVQIFCAHSIKALDCIVTRNIKNFRNSEIPALTPDELLKSLFN